MTEDMVLQIGEDALLLIVYLAAPLLLSALFVGLMVGVLQAVTQIQEQTLSFIPKLMALVVALIVMGPWLLQLWITFTLDLFMQIPSLIG
ncbi:MAG: flagellar biosynthetic protein FliQ [SAR86 cluster bacterium]|uniref:Flagellar biosynthetic protein FliQ n=1 Tax=SAR86 cluster bacterium TaxID=2030880 RepID=A0A2A4XGN2_9GAMM|nr:MAG: flagellar biosynthetic protein FliQ [SAR86 cluster bacterium]